MPKHTLYAYVDGSDNEDIEDSIVVSINDFLLGRNWVCRNPVLVNQKHIDDPTLGRNDAPDWDLGINIDLPEAGDEPPGWFSDINAVAYFLGELHEQTNRDFIIGIGDNETGISEDLFQIDSNKPDIDKLKNIVGVS